MLQHNEISPGGVLWVREKVSAALLGGGWGIVREIPQGGYIWVYFQRWACGADCFISRYSPPMKKALGGWKSRVFLVDGKLLCLDERVVFVTWYILTTSELWRNVACNSWNIWSVYWIADLKVNHWTTLFFLRLGNNSTDSICDYS